MIENFFARYDIPITYTPFAKMLCLNQTIKNGKIDNYAKLLNKEIKQNKSFAKETGFNIQIDNTRLNSIFKLLTDGSFFINFKFKLSSPWYSKEDDPYYLFENQIRKNLVFKIPEISSKAWKGYFRSACVDMEKEVGSLREQRLFGNERESENAVKGQLSFSPTFFDTVAYYNLNPHNRNTKAGTKPIYYEIVPENTIGCFSLLYQAGLNLEQDICQDDMKFAGDLIETVFHGTGFSAKRGIGFGKGNIIESENNFAVVKYEGTIIKTELKISA